MKHSSYLRVDGRLVFKVHGMTQFLRANDNDLELCRQRLDTLRDAVQNADGWLVAELAKPQRNYRYILSRPCSQRRSELGLRKLSHQPPVLSKIYHW